MQLSLTIIVPAFNEADCLEALVKDLNAFLVEATIPTSVLFVNDGSTDNTQEFIENICHQDKRYHYIHLASNRGLSTAFKAGVDHTNTTLIGYIDADLQTTSLDFPKLLEYIPEYDMVLGIRVNRRDGVVKRISSRVANSIRRSLIHDGISDTGCPLKIIKSEYLKKVPFFNGMHRFIPSLVQMQGGKVKQVPVQHFPRFAGTAKYNLWNRLIHPLHDAYAVRWMQKRFINYTIDKEE
ncbi:MAG: glycosyltransferase family 2 protein [Cyclobacteriaceae bacterium]|nr:glycosyltransferase family 2 protein [Cyclobacteriaceae bacterium]